MADRSPDEALLRRALLFSQVPGIRVAEVCERFGLTPAQLRRAKKELGPSVRLTDDDLVLMGLSRAAGPLGEADLIAFIDWVNHVVWSKEELAAALGRLEQAGRVRRTSGGWELAAEWP